MNGYQIFQFLLGGYGLFLLVFGTIGNTFSFYVFTKRFVPMSSTVMIMAFVCIPETIILYTWNLNYVYRELIRRQSNHNLEEISLAHCKIISYIAFTSYQISAWLRCYLTIERYMQIVLYRRRFIYTPTVRKALTICIILTVAVLIINVHVPIHNGYRLSLAQNGSLTTHSTSPSISIDQIAKGELGLGKYNNASVQAWKAHLSTKKIRCYARKGHYYYFSPMWEVTHNVLYCFIPSIIMTIFNVLLLLSIKRSGWTTMSSRHRARFHTLSTVVLLMNVLFVIMTVPAGIVHAIGDRMFLRDKPYRKLLLMLVTCLNTTVHASSCILYFAGSSIYRNALKCNPKYQLTSNAANTSTTINL